MHPTGDQFEISAADLRAVVTSVGGGLRVLRSGDRDLVAGFEVEEPRPVYRGSVLAPWPNRLADGEFTWRGATHSVPVNEPDRATALHGLVCEAEWSVVRLRPDSVQLEYAIPADAGWPAPLHLEVAYHLDAGGLTWRLAARNTGDSPVPYGCSVHPYLTVGDGLVDEWTFQLGASTYLAVSPDRLLPVAEVAVEGTAMDFRHPSSLTGRVVDHAFTDVAAGTDQLARAELRGRDGSGVAMTWNRSTLPWVQVHTADRPEPHLNRRGLAVEPMTCPPDAMASGIGVVRLQPGQSHRAVWRIEPVPPRC